MILKREGVTIPGLEVVGVQDYHLQCLTEMLYRGTARLLPHVSIASYFLTYIVKTSVWIHMCET